MGSKTNNSDNQYAVAVPLGSADVNGTKLDLTSSSGALSANKLTASKRYKLSLGPSASSPGFFKWASSVSLPASNADETEGFWLMPGESEIGICPTGATRIAGILESGTGTLYITRLPA